MLVILCEKCGSCCFDKKNDSYICCCCKLKYTFDEAKQHIVNITETPVAEHEVSPQSPSTGADK